MGEIPCLQLGEGDEAGLCGVEASTRLDAIIKQATGCTLNAREQALLGAGNGTGQVQTNMGQCQVAQGAQVIPGTIAYIPCPSVSIQMRMLELAHGCCPDVGHHEHRRHHGGGHHHQCGCGYDPCTC